MRCGVNCTNRFNTNHSDITISSGTEAKRQPDSIKLSTAIYKLHPVWWKCHYPDIHLKCPTFCPNLTNFGFSQQIFMKVPNIKFHENPSNGRCGDMCGETDRQTGEQIDEANSRFSRFIQTRLKLNYYSTHLLVNC